MLDSRDIDRIARYVSGEGTPDERAVTAEWGAEDPERAAAAAELLRLFSAAPAAIPPSDTLTALGRLRQSVGMPAPAPITPLVAGTGRRLASHRWNTGSTTGLRVAAAASLVIAFGLGWLIHVTAHRSSGDAMGPGARVYATRAMERLSVTLPDGSQFVLAPVSRIRIPAEYGRTMRDVALEGEAAFAVQHDVRLPFTVRTATARTVDVGTRFDVRAYAGDPATRIAVTEGEVAVSRVGHGLPAVISDMRAGDLAVVSDTGVSVTHGADVGALTAWTAGQLRVHDVSLRELVPDLARWYDIDVTVPDSALASRLVTASWAAQPTEQMLAELGALLNARVVRRGRAVTLVPRP